MVGGERRDVTTFMREVPGLMAKDGADGVFAAALPDGRAIALKIADGANRARPPVMVAAHSGVLAEAGRDKKSEAARTERREIIAAVNLAMMLQRPVNAWKSELVPGNLLPRE